MSEKDNTVYILDSYGLIYRAYFAFISRPLVNSRNENVSAVFGFFRNLLNILKKNNPGFMAAAFDSRTPTFRHEMYPEYKATRDKTPDDLHAQVPVIEEILTALQIPVLRKDGFEADDIIATVAAECEKQGRGCKILSGDKDLMQLVTETTTMLTPDKSGGWADTGINEVIEKWGVPPEKMLDMLSLCGDTADNVPGVAGIGEKTAAKLLAEYSDLDGIYAAADAIKGATGEKIRKGKDNAYFSKKLIKLDSNVPVELDFDSFTTENLDFAAAAKLLKQHGVDSVAKSFLENAGVSAEAASGAAAEGVSLGAASNAAAKTKGPAADGNGQAGLFDAEETPFSEADEEQTKEPVQNHGNYSAITKLSELKAFIDDAIAKKCVAFDTETDSLNTQEAKIAGFSLCTEPGTAVYVPLRVTDMLLAGELVSEKEALAELNRLFQTEGVTVIMHNAKYDLEVLHTAGLNVIHKGAGRKAEIADTMIIAWLLQPDKTEGNGKISYSLEKLAETKLFIKGIEFDSIVPKNSTFMDIPLESAVPYAAEDADFTLKLFQFFEPQLKKKNLEKLFALEMQVLPVLAQMEINGIRIEKHILEEYKGELKSALASIEKDIYDIAGHTFNIASPKQLGTILFEELSLPHGKKTKSGYSTDTSVLEELALIHPLPAKILDYRAKAKLLSTYVETLPLLADKNSRIHTSFLQTGTATGRLSSRDPNLQNIPVRDEEGRRIRVAFTAPEGKNLVTADYSQIELVVLAHLSKDENMCSAFKNSKDIHKSTAALIFGKSEDEVTADMRRAAKRINFGVIYGMSAFRLAKDLGISRTQAQEFISHYFATYNGINSFMNETVQKAEQTGYVETLLGRRRFIHNINSRNKLEKTAAERIAINTPVQGSAADIVKMAMTEVYKKLEEKKSSAKMLLQVHDELILECDEAETEEVSKLLKETMENIIKLEVPLKVSVESGKNWGEFH